MPLFSKLRKIGTKKGILEEAVNVPPRDTPGHFMYNKHGISAILYLDLWVDYTKDLETVHRWPATGTWDSECIMRVEEQLWKRKSRPSQKEAIELWRKEANRRALKELNKAEKSRQMSEQAKEKELLEEGEQVRAEQMDRERNALVAGIYPVLSEEIAEEVPQNVPLKIKPTAPEAFLSAYLAEPPPAYIDAPFPPLPPEAVPQPVQNQQQASGGAEGGGIRK